MANTEPSTEEPGFFLLAGFTAGSAAGRDAFAEIAAVGAAATVGGGMVPDRWQPATTISMAMAQVIRMSRPRESGEFIYTGSIADNCHFGFFRWPAGKVAECPASLHAATGLQERQGSFTA